MARDLAQRDVAVGAGGVVLVGRADGRRFSCARACRLVSPDDGARLASVRGGRRPGAIRGGPCRPACPQPPVPRRRPRRRHLPPGSERPAGATERDGDAVVAALAAGRLHRLVVAGVDADDTYDPPVAEPPSRPPPSSSRLVLETDVTVRRGRVPVAAAPTGRHLRRLEVVRARSTGARRPRRPSRPPDLTSSIAPTASVARSASDPCRGARRDEALDRRNRAPYDVDASKRK